MLMQQWASTASSINLFGHFVQNGRNAMHMAAQGGHIEVIKFLSPMFGAKVHEKTEGSYTMLHWAAQNGHSQVARYLIDKLQMDPQNRDKVCGCQRLQGLYIMYVCTCVVLCSETCDKVVWLCIMGTENSPVLCL